MEAMNFYKSRGWNVVSNPTYSTKMKLKRINDEDWSPDRYQRKLKSMICYLGLVNTKGNNISWHYHGLYKKVNKQFNTNVF